MAINDVVISISGDVRQVVLVVDHDAIGAVHSKLTAIS